MSKFSPCIDLRDYATPDSGKDATTGIQKALADAAQSGNPSTVKAIAGEWIMGPVTIPAGGVNLVGEGMMGEGIHDARATVFTARDQASDSGPALSLDARASGTQWIRGSFVESIAVNVSSCARFQVEQPPPVYQFAGASNCGPFRKLIAYGNRGTAIKVIPNPNVSNAISENLSFHDCGCYAGYRPDGSYRSDRPTQPLVVVEGSDRITFHSGLYAYGYAPNAKAIPTTGDLTDMPAFFWVPQVQPDRLAVRPSVGGGLYGVAITNMPVSVRVGAIDFNGEVYGPTRLRFRDVEIENFNQAVQIGVGDTTGALGWNTSSDIIISGLTTLGDYAWYGKDHYQLLIDKVRGARFEVPYIGPNDLYVTQNASHTRGVVGPNPYGPGMRAVNYGNDTRIEYAN